MVFVDNRIEIQEDELLYSDEDMQSDDEIQLDDLESDYDMQSECNDDESEYFKINQDSESEINDSGILK